jgi:hypothetical protein
MTWLPERAGDAPGIGAILGLVPAACEPFGNLHARLFDGGALPPRTLDLCRRRVAMLLGVDPDDGLPHPDGAAGASAEQAAALRQWPTAPAFTDDERACLAFAEQYVLDPHGFSDADVRALEARLGAPGVAALVLGIAVFEATARFRAALDP